MKQAIENIEFYGIKENEFTTLLNCNPIFTIHDIKNLMEERFGIPHGTDFSILF